MAELKLDVFEPLTGVGGDCAMGPVCGLRAFLRSFADGPVLCAVLEDEREQWAASPPAR